MNALDEIRARAAHTDSTNRAERAQYREDHDRMLAALDELLYIADNKTADNQIGRWWAATIRGAIEKALGGKP